MKNELQHGYLYRKKLVVAVLLLVDALLKLIPFKRRPAPREPKKILLVKPDHLGDCVLSTSVIAALRGRSVIIDYLAGPWGAAVLKSYPEIRKIWTIRHAQLNRSSKGLGKWIQFWSDLLKVVPLIRAERYDAVLFLRASGGNFVFTGRFFGAGFLAGHAAGGGGALLDAIAAWTTDVHETDHFTEVLRLLDSALRARTPFYPGSTEPLAGLPSEYICVHPGAGADSKKLSPETWSRILNASKLPLVVCGTPADSVWIKSLQIDPHRTVIDLTQGLSIPDVFRVFANAHEMHGLDSFPAHLAAASPCGRVFVHFLPASDPVQWRPVGPNVEVILHASP